MMELYNRMGNLDLIDEIVLSEKTVFIYEIPDWDSGEGNKSDRGGKCKEKLQPKNILSIEYKREDTDGVTKERFQGRLNGGDAVLYDSLDDVAMFKFVDKIFSQYHSLIVDITLMDIRFLGAFLAILPFYEWENVYFCYTEPGEYTEKLEGNLETTPCFDLKYNMRGFSEIPNLETLSDNTTPCKWILFLGFEGSRLDKLNVEAAPKRKFVIPVMSIPSMRIEWRNYVMEVNRNEFENIGEMEKIKYVSAINPFEVYNFLIAEKNQQEDIHMKISPLGTKLTVLGSIMYLIENMEDMILTDNPYQSDENAINCGNSYLYDLSFFVKQVKNKRFKKKGE